MFWIIAALIASYVAAIFTWPKIRTWIVGAEAEIALLREKARALEAKVKSFTGS
jgi:hypothetical protein